MIQMKKMVAAVAVAAASVGGAHASGSITFESIVAGDVIGGVTVTNTPTNSPNKNVLNKGASWEDWVFYTGTGSANSTTAGTSNFGNIGASSLSANTDTYLFGTSSIAAIIANTGAAGGTTMPSGTTTASWQAIQSEIGNWAIGLGGSKSLNIKSASGTTTLYDKLYLFNASTADKQATVYVSGYTGAGTASQTLVASQTFTLDDETGGYYNLTSFAGIGVDGLTISSSGGKFLIVDNITAVPEASTYAMLLAGLGMIGVIARRRTQA